MKRADRLILNMKRADRLILNMKKADQTDFEQFNEH